MADPKVRTPTATAEPSVDLNPEETRRKRTRSHDDETPEEERPRKVASDGGANFAAMAAAASDEMRRLSRAGSSTHTGGEAGTQGPITIDARMGITIDPKHAMDPQYSKLVDMVKSLKQIEYEMDNHRVVRLNRLQGQEGEVLWVTVRALQPVNAVWFGGAFIPCNPTIKPMDEFGQLARDQQVSVVIPSRQAAGLQGHSTRVCVYLEGQDPRFAAEFDYVPMQRDLPLPSRPIRSFSSPLPVNKKPAEGATEYSAIDLLTSLQAKKAGPRPPQRWEHLKPIMRQIKQKFQKAEALVCSYKDTAEPRVWATVSELSTFLMGLFPNSTRMDMEAVLLCSLQKAQREVRMRGQGPPLGAMGAQAPSFDAGHLLAAVFDVSRRLTTTRRGRRSSPGAEPTEAEAEAESESN